MSVLHMPYDDSPFIRQREQSSYEMGLALEIKPTSLLHDPYLFDQFIHPLGPLSSSHSMPYDMHRSLEASHYHLGSPPYDFHGQNGGDVHHPTPMRPVPTGLEWSETTPRAYYPESSSSQYYPPTSISQPSMFVSSTSSRSLAPSDTTSTVDRSAPPPPWTMSGSLDPSTGVYMVAPEHPRIRTAQACEKCRGRKAKCSGEHPTCERCRIRGLKCEYAPERKMRGPNKVKRKTADKSSRRISVASTASDVSATSTTSDASALSSESTSDSSSLRAVTPPHVEFQQFTMKLGKPDSYSRPSTASSSHSSSSGGSPSRTNAQTDSRAYSRPSHIDLSGTRLSDQMSISYVTDNDTFAYEISDARRQSLPARFMDSQSHHAHIRSPSLGQVYTPSRGIDVIDASVPRTVHSPHSNPVHNHHPFNVPLAREGPSGGNEPGVSMSAPITPLTMPQEELMYPMDFQTEFMDLVSLDPMHMDTHGVHSWQNVGADVDATPRVASDGHEKSLAQFETQYAQS